MDEAPEEEEEDRALEPPAPIRVARRSLVLAAVTCRGEIEGNPAEEEFRASVEQWAVGVLSDELEPAERQILSTPIGELADQVRIDASWRSEGLIVLAWALGYAELPPHDRQVAQAAGVADRLGFMAAQPRALQEPRLRSAAELQHLAEVMFTFHWRLREFSLRPRHMDFTTFAKSAWFGPLVVDGLEFAEDDLAVDGAPLVRSTRWHDVLSIAMERHQAANWLTGHDPLYSEVATNT